MEEQDLFSRLARHEVGWWQRHHRRDKPGLIHEMASLYQHQFGIPYEVAVRAVQARVAATKEHDLAEAFEDKGDMLNANAHWKNVETLLRQHFGTLVDAQNRTTDRVLGIVSYAAVLPSCVTGFMFFYFGGPVGVVLGTAAMVNAGLLFTRSCYHSTPPSERPGWLEQHPSVIAPFRQVA